MSEFDYKSFSDRLEELKKRPSAFIEEICGIKLLPYQKYLLNNYVNNYKCGKINSNRKWNQYINMCLAYLEMNDDDYIAIINHKKVEKLSKENFYEYLKAYWK